MRKLSQLCNHKTRTLFGQTIQQSWASIWVIEEMLRMYKPDRIVELGTGRGVLSLHFIAYCWFTDAKFMTIDIHRRSINGPVDEYVKNNPQLDFVRADICAEDTRDKVAEFLNVAERPFILVDGKDPKSNDVNFYAPVLKAGTVMFAHDCVIEETLSKVSKEASGKPKWCFEEDKINWDHVERHEPYYSHGRDFDTRMLALIRSGK